MADLTLSVKEIEAILFDETVRQGGLIVQSYSDESRLYARTVNPQETEVAPRDRVQGGVAVRVGLPNVQVASYIYRQICSNGAVVPVKGVQDCVDLSKLNSPYAQEERLRTLISACGRPGVLEKNAEKMRSLRGRAADIELVVLRMAARYAGSDEAVLDILERYRSESQDLFGAMQAVTALARDTADQARKWRLEEAGGGVLAVLEDPELAPRDAVAWPEHCDDWIAMVR